MRSRRRRTRSTSGPQRRQDARASRVKASRYDRLGQAKKDLAASYCTDTTRSSRDREVDGNVVAYTASFARMWRSNGSRKRSSTTPNTGIEKLRGSRAKNPKASVAHSSQVGRFGCRSASHTSRRSLRLIRHSLNILRIMPSRGPAYYVRLRALKVVQCGARRRALKQRTLGSFPLDHLAKDGSYFEFDIDLTH